MLIAKEHFSSILMEYWPESTLWEPELSEAGKLICESLGLVDNSIEALNIKCSVAILCFVESKILVIGSLTSAWVILKCFRHECGEYNGSILGCPSYSRYCTCPDQPYNNEARQGHCYFWKKGQ